MKRILLLSEKFKLAVSFITNEEIGSNKYEENKITSNNCEVNHWVKQHHFFISGIPKEINTSYKVNSVGHRYKS